MNKDLALKDGLLYLAFILGTLGIQIFETNVWAGVVLWGLTLASLVFRTLIKARQD